MSIAENLAHIARDIDMALRRRRPDMTGTGTKVKIVAVTKNQAVETVREAVDAGASAVGENRVQEALTKVNLLDRQVEWHLIGHLQTNKVRQAVPLFGVIHSVDSDRLAVEIDKVAAKVGKRQDVLIQVNVADEDTKYGIAPDELSTLARMISNLEHTRLCGLMTIAPYYAAAEDARPVFREMYRLFMELKAGGLANTNIEWLSMGMTNDYTVAVEEGANLVRVGTAIFGPRHYNEEVQ
jgi:pyridoxal phosphate enzyme (YggS family)